MPILTAFNHKLMLLSAVLGLTAILASSQLRGAEDPVLVRISADDAAVLSATAIKPIRIIDYDSFLVLELTADDAHRLSDAGLHFDRLPSPTDFSLQGQAVDTGSGILSASSLESVAPRQSSAGDEQAQFYLVQVLGPMKQDWSKRLQASDIHSLRYFNPFVHLVHITPVQASELAQWDIVRWIGSYLPRYRISQDLLQRSEDPIENVDVSILGASLNETVQAIELLGGVEVDRDLHPGADGFVTVTFQLPSTALEPTSQLAAVSWISYRATSDPMEDEMSDQIISGNFGPITTGYLNWLNIQGLSGAGITVAALDTGYDTGVDGTSHPDLSGRLVMVGNPIDTDGHGTHVGGIIAGNASLGKTDGGGFLLGLGVAPQATLVVRYNNGTDSARQMDAVTRSAVASNNSYAVNSAGDSYSARDAALDGLVRDADTSDADNDQMSIIFSTGNSGNSGPTKNAKNIIAVGNSWNERNSDGTVNNGNNIDVMATGSSRGPAGDGRIYPHVSAPGSRIMSTKTSQPAPPADSCEDAATAVAPAADPTYSICSGTSMAAPHVTGAVALIHQWWSGTPSPAMVKALLINSAVDMDNADIPNNNEGWGRINLDTAINPGVATEYLDQSTVFSGSGQAWTDNFSPIDQGQQVRVTVVWTDAPGTAAGVNDSAPDLVNDLDLVVSDDSNSYRGNVFSSGLSTTGGSADNLNNTENVFLANPADAFSVTVTAAGINGDGIPGNGDGTDQDFALVCTNCVPNMPPVCDANGPYVAECGLNTDLDGSGSSDPDANPLSYSWSGPFTGSPTSGVTPTVVFPTPTGLKAVNLEVNDSLASDFCSSPVTVQDTLDPSITAQGDREAECAAPEGTPVDLGVPVAGDACDPDPTVTNDAPALFPLGDTTVTWTVTDDDANQASDTQLVSIVDTTPPELFCNSPATIIPPDAPITLTATAEDQCQGPLTPVILDYDCFTYTKKGKRIDKTNSCEISIEGDSITILDSGGVGDQIEWTVSAEDDQGNAASSTCSLAVINPGKN